VLSARNTIQDSQIQVQSISHEQNLTARTSQYSLRLTYPEGNKSIEDFKTLNKSSTVVSINKNKVKNTKEPDVITTEDLKTLYALKSEENGL